jgi:NAD(P)-dependent dehydrogenase (short-subunit alcohol dehydrogenase family)
VSEVAGIAGAISLTQAMALDLGPQGVRVNAVSAGGQATPVDIAHAALFLASEMAVRVNGATFAVGS